MATIHSGAIFAPKKSYQLEIPSQLPIENFQQLKLSMMIEFHDMASAAFSTSAYHTDNLPCGESYFSDL
jgi:hypothetical protein